MSNSITISLQIQEKTENNREKSIPLEQLIYLTEKIDLDITECHTIVVTNVPSVLEESVLRFISARVDCLVSTKTCKDFLIDIKKGLRNELQSTTATR